MTNHFKNYQEIPNEHNALDSLVEYQVFLRFSLIRMSNIFRSKIINVWEDQYVHVFFYTNEVAIQLTTGFPFICTYLNLSIGIPKKERKKEA